MKRLGQRANLTSKVSVAEWSGWLVSGDSESERPVLQLSFHLPPGEMFHNKIDNPFPCLGWNIRDWVLVL